MVEALEGRLFLSAHASAASLGRARAQRLAAAASEAQPLKRAAASNLLKVSPNGHYLVKADGSPFFYMADTAWELFNSTTRREADLYLETRAAQGFTVIQAEAIARFGPNRAGGDRAFINDDPTRPNEAYFKYVDYVVRKANSLGMYVAFVPFDSEWAANGVFKFENVYSYGRFVGKRYAGAKVIWVLGGDVGATRGDGVRMWREAASGITRGAANRDASKVLITYHPFYNQSSSNWFHNDAWLDFNSIQSGQSANRANYNAVAEVYAKNPAKPVMDIETGYEDIPSGLRPGNPRLTAQDVRKMAYWSVFAGSFGVTFGNNNVWQFVRRPSGTKRDLATTVWQKALASAGARSMTTLKRLMLSRPLMERVPDQSLLVGPPASGADHVQATRGSDGSYAFVYTATGKPVTVNLSKLSGKQVEARWYSPRKPKSTYIGVFARNGNHTFTPPTQGDDWVLVLDDVAKHYGRP